MAVALAYRVSWNGGISDAVRAYLMAAIYAIALVSGVAMAAVLTPVVTPFVIAALPVVGQFIGGMALIAALAYVSYPK